MIRRSKPIRRKSYLKRSRPPKKAQLPEELIQDYTDGYLDRRGISYIRIPDAIYKKIFDDKSVNESTRIMIGSYIAGLPDNTLCLPISDKFFLGCAVECKSDVGRMGQKQRYRAVSMKTNIIRYPEELHELVREFEDTADKLVEFFKNENISTEPVRDDNSKN